MTKAIRIQEYGGPDVLKLEDVTVKTPGSGEVRIRHTAIGLNFIDTYQRTRLYKVELPATLGSEAAGVIEEVGPDVTGFAVGDRVGYCSGPLGAYCEARVFPAARLVKLPAGISDEVAAASMLKGMTAEYLIRRAYEVRRGQTVLVHAAAGGVGLIACQWLRHLGATVIGTVSSEEKAALAREHGCEHTIIYTKENFAQRVREITGGKGVPVVYDSTGKDTLEASLDCVSHRGTVVSFGNSSGRPPAIDPLVLGQKGSLYLTRTVLAHFIATREELDASAKALFDVIGSGAVRVDVRQRFPLSKAAESTSGARVARDEGVDRPSSSPSSVITGALHSRAMKSRVLGSIAILIVAPFLLSSCASGAVRAAKSGDQNELATKLKAKIAEGSLSNGEAGSVAVAVAERGIRTASGDPGIARIRELRSCARDLDGALEDREKPLDGVAVEAAWARAFYGDMSTGEARDYAKSAEPRLRAIAALGLVRDDDAAARRKAMTDSQLEARRGAMRAAMKALDPQDIPALAEAVRVDPDGIVSH